MKTKLTALLVILAFTCSAQTVKFVTDNLKDVRQTADSIALNAKRSYKYSYEKQISGTTLYVIKYVNISDTTDYIPVAFNVRTKGANQALEIKGTTEYVFNRAEGKFLDLFTFWKRQINPKANAVEISTGYDEKQIGNNRFMFGQHDDKWSITMN